MTTTERFTVKDTAGQATAEIILVPCAESGRAGCEVVQRAVARVREAVPEAAVARPEDCPRGRSPMVVAVDGCAACAASAELEQQGVRPAAVVSAPAALARRGLLRPGVEVRARVEELAEALAEELRETLRDGLEEVCARRRYREEMAPVMQRFQGLWARFEELPALADGHPTPEQRSRVELPGKRCRNLFTRLDEVAPPAPWAEEHDLFQDALLCLAYASEGWVSRDAARFEQNLEKARVQLRPLLRRLGG